MSESSSSSLSCPQCGATLPSESTESLCPRCLLSQAMRTQPVAPPTSTVRPASALTPEELAPFFPQYEIQRVLGRGGMGAVYLARQISLNRLVAIKILPAGLDDGFNNFAERFKNEAQAMAQLSHPGIVAVYDFGETTNGLLYIAMEYIDGTDVQQMVVNQGRLHSAHAMAITAHVCDALAYAHGKGIIHRDIKPSNIMINQDGVVKVADFGLAKVSRGGETTGITQSGLVMGTLYFMAPEALTLGSEVDQRADIYAVGVMLYQMLTGKLPQGLFEMPSMQVSGLDPRYDGIVAKALREDRALRYQNAGELRQDLDAILTQPVVKVEPEHSQAPAAVDPSVPQEKPQRSPGQVDRPPPSRASVAKKKKSGSGLIIAAAVVLIAAIAGFLFLGKGGSQTETIKATKDAPFVNSLDMKFVPVPGTKVLVSVWETRVRDYAEYARLNNTDGTWKGKQLDGIPIGREPDHPVCAVSWNDCKSFCEWLTNKERAEGKLPPELEYRLPNSAEWSSASGREIPWKPDKPQPEARSGNFGDETFHKHFPNAKNQSSPNAKPWIEGYDDGYATTSPVGALNANKHGIFDMFGNLWEWCEDIAQPGATARVARGQCWHDFLQSWFNWPHISSREPNERSMFFGFRCVVAPAGSAASAGVNDLNRSVGDDRKAAGWVLSIGGSVVIEESGKELSPSKLQDLPKGSFVIKAIRLAPSSAKNLLMSEGLTPLAGLLRLSRLTVVDVNLKDSDYRLLLSLPALTEVYFTRTGIRDENLASILDHGGLRNIGLNDEHNVTNEGVAILRSAPSLIAIALVGCSFVTSETVKEIAQWSKLEGVELTASNLGDADLSALNNLNKLTSLRLGKIPGVTVEGLRGLTKREMITNLAINLPQKDPSAAIEQIAQMFPNLEMIHFSQLDTQKHDVELAGVSRFSKLKKVALTGAGFGNATLDVLAKMPGLELMSIETSSVTPDAVAAAMKANPKLKITLR